MMFPTANSPCPRRTAVIAVTSSGNEVPNATNVAAMISSGMLNFMASVFTVGIRICADTTTNAIDPISLNSVRTVFDSLCSVSSSCSEVVVIAPAQRIDCHTYNPNRTIKANPMY